MGKRKKNKPKGSMIKIREIYVRLFICFFFLTFGLTFVVWWATANPTDYPYEVRRGYRYYWEVVVWGIMGSVMLLISIFETIRTLLNKRIRNESQEFSRDDLKSNFIWIGIPIILFIFITVMNITGWTITIPI